MASRDIGAATARLLAAKTARESCSRAVAALEAVAAGIREAGAEAVAIRADLTTLGYS